MTTDPKPSLEQAARKALENELQRPEFEHWARTMGWTATSLRTFKPARPVRYRNEVLEAGWQEWLAKHPPQEGAEALAQGRAGHTIERHFALREAHANKAEGDYFEPRPVEDGAMQRRAFNAGFVRGFDAGEKVYAAAPTPATEAPKQRLPKGWLLDSIEERESGIVRLGHRNEDGEFFEVVTIDTDNYFKPEDAMPIAQAIVAALATPAQEDARAPAAPEPGQGEATDRFPHCHVCNSEFFPFCARRDCPSLKSLQDAVLPDKQAAEPQPQGD